jgi:glucokinase
MPPGGRPVRGALSSTVPGYGIGVDVGGSHVAGAVASPGGEIIWRTEQPLDDVMPDGAVSLACLQQTLDAALCCILSTDRAVVCVGAPGLIDYRSGVVEDARAVGWAPLALRGILEERYRLPVLLENDVNLATLGEARYGAGKGVEHLVCMFIGTNIGGGIIVNGHIYRGAHGGAGEIGWMVPESALLQRPHLPEGCLEAYAGGLGIAQQAQRALAADPAGGRTLLHVAGGRPEAVRAEHVFAAAPHDAVAAAVLERVFDYLGVAVANIICLLDPEMIVIGGGVARAGDAILPAVRTRIAGLSAHQPRLALSELGQDAALLGALALAQDYQP